ncbi:MAG: hypothetical protein NVS1B11_25500 [Terriglobales bacterium]
MKAQEPLLPPTEPLPLRGIRILVGRARHQASALSVRLRALGADVIEIPFIEIRKPASYLRLDASIRNVGRYDWLILTSVNGVAAFWERLQKLNFTNTQLRHVKVAAIGPATRRAIEKHGVNVDVVPERYVAEAVVEVLRTVVKGKRVLLARAKVARDVIPQELGKLGAHVDVVEAYETVIPKTSSKQLKKLFRSSALRPHVITFTSSSTVKNFFALLKSPGNIIPPKIKSELHGIKLASIGPVTSATLRELGFFADIEAKQFDIPGLVKAIQDARASLVK